MDDDNTFQEQLIVYAGETGLAGPQGKIGIQGFQGIEGMGMPGVQGDAGANGAQGSKGFQGIQGLIGAGPAGVQGLQGVDGPQGVPSVIGGLFTPTSLVVTTTATNLTVDILPNTIQFIVQGNINVSDVSGFPTLYIQFSQDGITYPDFALLQGGLNSPPLVYYNTLFINDQTKWYKGVEKTTLISLGYVPTKVRLYAAKSGTPTVPINLITDTTITCITMSF